jgi:hypothetical protein
MTIPWRFDLLNHDAAIPESVEYSQYVFGPIGRMLENVVLLRFQGTYEDVDLALGALGFTEWSMSAETEIGQFEAFSTPVSQTDGDIEVFLNGVRVY